MNEKLKQEAEEGADKWIKWAIDHKALTYWNSFVEGYLASAKPREKEIKSLGERCLQLQKDKGNLTDRISDLEDKLANADYQLEGRDNEIRELEAQIEKMKKYIKACWVEENLNDYSSYMTNTSDEFRDLVHELNEEIRNGR